MTYKGHRPPLWSFLSRFRKKSPIPLDKSAHMSYNKLSIDILPEKG